MFNPDKEVSTSSGKQCKTPLPLPQPITTKPLKLQNIEKQQHIHQSTTQEEEVVDPDRLSFTFMRDAFIVNLIGYDLPFSIHGNTPSLIQEVQTSE